MADLGKLEPRETRKVSTKGAKKPPADGWWVFVELSSPLATHGHRHPQVKEAAFVQVRDRTVLALSRRRLFADRDPEEFVYDLSTFSRRNLPPDIFPDEIRWFAELPRSPLAKVLRREVRARLEQEAE